MPASQVSVCNSAILKVGGDVISSITQNVRAAIICNTLYDGIRDQVLRDHPWHFAIKRAILVPTATTPDFEWDFEYDIPNDCLRILTDWPDWETSGLNFNTWTSNTSPGGFVEEGNKLLSDNDTLNIRYIFRNTDESSWSADFAEAMAWKLASEIAYPLTQSLALSQACMAAYLKMLAEARSIGSMVGNVRGFEASTWTNSRR